CIQYAFLLLQSVTGSWQFFFFSAVKQFTGTCTQYSCTRQYHFVNENKTWTEAQRYCRQNYIDLATIENMEEMNRLIKTVRGTYFGSTWIGLYDDLNSWRWSLDNAALEGGFKSWFVQQQVNSGGQSLCVYVSYYRGIWSEAFCSYRYPFVCYDGENYCWSLKNYNKILMIKLYITYLNCFQQEGQTLVQVMCLFMSTKPGLKLRVTAENITQTSLVSGMRLKTPELHH
uniref:C-type lectin domain-containing protein n=1 Tax=Cyprinus carpio TaxID=7962 RepID=A0A8C2I6I1_CYPCA